MGLVLKWEIDASLRFRLTTISITVVPIVLHSIVTLR